MKALVTGAKGFLGTHLCANLEKNGWDVARTDRDDEEGPDHDLVVCPELIAELLEVHEPDVVFHLAGYYGGRDAGYEPLAVIQDNLCSATVVAEVLLGRDIRMVLASDTSVYGRVNGVCDEDDGPFELPLTINGSSHLWAEEAAAHYVPPERLRILRLGNVYGPGDDPSVYRNPMHEMLWLAANGLFTGDIPQDVYSWIYVEDAVNSIRAVAEQWDSPVAVPGHEWVRLNVVRDDDPRAMIELAELAYGLAGQSMVYIGKPSLLRGHMYRYSDARITQFWKPEVSIVRGMNASLPWYARWNKDGELDTET